MGNIQLFASDFLAKNSKMFLQINILEIIYRTLLTCIAVDGKGVTRDDSLTDHLEFLNIQCYASALY